MLTYGHKLRVFSLFSFQFAAKYLQQALSNYFLFIFLSEIKNKN